MPNIANPSAAKVIRAKGFALIPWPEGWELPAPPFAIPRVKSQDKS